MIAIIIAAVFRQLPPPDCCPEVKQHIERAIEKFFFEGWTVADMVLYFSCLEEFNPSLDEDVALKCMATIAAKYKEKAA
jgi:nitric oxide reductase activation protein